ncbi:hypothetical protein CS550_07190 [Porphyromonas gingivalis]|nr:hypothetical protein CS550_07190 [Porphyromonas gingivalis]
MVELLTNINALSASNIALLYRSGWLIETFFRNLKQRLSIKSFLSTTRNAVEVRIWTALITMLFGDCCGGVSLSSFAAELILSVFGKGQTSGIWTLSKQKFPQVSIREALLSSSNRREIRNDCRLFLASCTMQDAIVG